MTLAIQNQDDFVVILNMYASYIIKGTIVFIEYEHGYGEI